MPESTQDNADIPAAHQRHIFDSACYIAGKSVGKIPLAGDVIAFGCSRVEARWRYIELQPLLLDSLKRFGPTDRNTRFLIKEIVATANVGACRQNFENWYVKGDRLKDLPADPDDIMYGYW